MHGVSSHNSMNSSGTSGVETVGEAKWAFSLVCIYWLYPINTWNAVFANAWLLLNTGNGRGPRTWNGIKPDPTHIPTNLEILASTTGLHGTLEPQTRARDADILSVEVMTNPKGTITSTAFKYAKYANALFLLSKRAQQFDGSPVLKKTPWRGPVYSPYSYDRFKNRRNYLPWEYSKCVCLGWGTNNKVVTSLQETKWFGWLVGPLGQHCSTRYACFLTFYSTAA